MLANEDSMLFVKTIHRYMSLKKSFRVFANDKNEMTNKERMNRNSQHEAENLRPKIEPLQWIRAYTDGFCENNGYENARVEAVIWYGDKDLQNTATKVPLHLKQSNNTGEALAILIATNQTNTNNL